MVLYVPRVTVHSHTGACEGVSCLKSCDFVLAGRGWPRDSAMSAHVSKKYTQFAKCNNSETSNKANLFQVFFLQAVKTGILFTVNCERFNPIFLVLHPSG